MHMCIYMCMFIYAHTCVLVYTCRHRLYICMLYVWENDIQSHIHAVLAILDTPVSFYYCIRFNFCWYRCFRYRPTFANISGKQLKLMDADKKCYDSRCESQKIDEELWTSVRTFNETEENIPMGVDALNIHKHQQNSMLVGVTFMNNQ